MSDSNEGVRQAADQHIYQQGFIKGQITKQDQICRTLIEFYSQADVSVKLRGKCVKKELTKNLTELLEPPELADLVPAPAQEPAPAPAPEGG